MPTETMKDRSWAVHHPYASVRVDLSIARLAVSPSSPVAGVVHDVETGLVEVVDPPRTKHRTA